MRGNFPEEMVKLWEVWPMQVHKGQESFQGTDTRWAGHGMAILRRHCKGLDLSVA